MILFKKVFKTNLKGQNYSQYVSCLMPHAAPCKIQCYLFQNVIYDLKKKQQHFFNYL